MGTITQRPLLSLIVPARNESALIAASVARLDEVLSTLGITYEIVVSDSASIDQTAAIVSALGLRTLSLVRNDRTGKGRALAAGMARARGEYLGFIDADMEIDAVYIAPLLDAVIAGADFAIASKTFSDHARSAHRRLATFCYNSLIRLLLDTPYRDHQAGLKIFRADCIHPLLHRVSSDGWFWDTEVLFALHRMHARCTEVPVVTARQRNSSVSFWRVSFELLLSALRLRLARRHPRYPVRSVPVPITAL
jgi:dolichyl-phosphate beta-glucosyltransferase